VTVILQ